MLLIFLSKSVFPYLKFPLDGLTPGGVSVFSTTIGTQRGGPNATVDELATVMRMSKEVITLQK